MNALWTLLAPLVLGATTTSCSEVDKPPTVPFSFVDVTDSSGLDLTLTTGADPPQQIVEVKGGGLALLDFDDDGDLDVFAPNGATLDSPERGPGARLFSNEGGLTFRDVTGEAGIDYAGWGMGVAVGDLDGEGADDIFIASFGSDALLLNRGGRFEDATAASGLGDDGWGTGAALGDVDLDGDLDLYLVRYLGFDLASPPPPTTFLGVRVFDGPSGLPALADRLYTNNGSGVFEDKTAASGCGDVRPSFGLGALILDFDEDGRADIFVGNDSMANFLFAGRTGGRFEEIGLASGIAVNADGETQATMGIAYGDVNGDLRADLFSTNFMSDTNALHVSRGDGLQFVDKTQLYGLGMVSRPFLGWAAMFYDLDQDGDEDLLAFNGHVYPEEAVAALGTTARQTPLLFERELDRFVRVPAEGEPRAWLAQAHNDRSAVFGDLDGDLDIDVIVGERNGPVRVLRNDGAQGFALIVRLRVTDGRERAKNPRGIGAKLTLEGFTPAGDRWTQVRWIASGGSYLSACAAEAHFGLGTARGPFTLTVRWPDGRVDSKEVEPGWVGLGRKP